LRVANENKQKLLGYTYLFVPSIVFGFCSIHLLFPTKINKLQVYICFFSFEFKHESTVALLLRFPHAPPPPPLILSTSEEGDSSFEIL
jgi:hypothetical protein